MPLTKRVGPFPSSSMEEQVRPRAADRAWHWPACQDINPRAVPRAGVGTLPAGQVGQQGAGPRKQGAPQCRNYL